MIIKHVWTFELLRYIDRELLCEGMIVLWPSEKYFGKDIYTELKKESLVTKPSLLKESMIIPE